MKTRFFLPFLLACLSILSAEDLTTTDGKTYTGVTVTKVDPDGLRITHSAGTAKIPFDKLSDEIQKKHNYDPFNAYDHEQAEKVKQAEIAKAEAARAAQKAKEMAQFKSDKAFEQSQENAKNWGRMNKLSKGEDFLRVADGAAHLGLNPPVDSPKTRGVVVTLQEGTLGKVPVLKGKTKVGEREGWTFSKKKTVGYVESKTGSTGEVMLYPIGQARFLGLDGNKKTMFRYTDDIEVAARFYHKNGTPPTCLDVVTDFTEGTKP